MWLWRPHTVPEQMGQKAHRSLGVPAMRWLRALMLTHGEASRGHTTPTSCQQQARGLLGCRQQTLHLRTLATSKVAQTTRGHREPGPSRPLVGSLAGCWGTQKGTLKLPHPTPSYSSQPPAVHPSPHTNGLWRPPQPPPRQKIPPRIATALLMRGCWGSL